jgi:uncharacterized protein YeaC (DUF1315 family)
VSFFLIAVPTAILLLNEAIGSALVGAAIPSIYSSLLLGGAYLFQISLVAMLLPYCLMIGVPCYITFVYRSSIIAYAKRAAERRRAAREGTPLSVSTRFRSRNSNRKDSHVDTKQVSPQAKRTGSALRLLRHLNHAFQGTVAFFSPYHLVTRRARVHAENMMWRSMNMPQTSQGSVPFRCISPAARKPVPRVLKKMRSLRFTPMLSACEEVTPNLDGLFSEVDNEEEEIDNDFSTMLEINSKQLEVPPTVEEAGPMKLPRLNSLIVFETEEALSMMRRKLAMHNSRGSQEVLTNVSTADLMDEFKEVLEIFYPHGVAMTESEKEEACKLFALWRDKQNTRHNVSFVDAPSDDVPMASFPQFESWFSVNLIRTMHNVKTERDKEVESQRLEAEANRKVSKSNVLTEVKSPLSNLFPDEAHRNETLKEEKTSSMAPIEVMPEEVRSKANSDTQYPSPTHSRPAGSSRIWPIP